MRVRCLSLCFLFVHLQLVIADPPQLVPVPDETISLPNDNVASFSPSQQISLQLDSLAALGVNRFDGALVTVIRPTGQTSQSGVSADGIAQFSIHEEGPHAFVATGSEHHGAQIVFMKSDGAAGDGRRR